MMVNGGSIFFMVLAHSLTPMVTIIKESLLRVNGMVKVLTIKNLTRLCKKDNGKMISVMVAEYLSGLME